MENQFSRTELLFGKEAINKLKSAKVAIFGVGGVGGYTVEALARMGVGNIDIIDNDVVAESNINRQIIATHSTVGKYKVDVARERILDINPNACVHSFKTFFLPENADEFKLADYDYIVDAIDTVSGKIALAVNAEKVGTPIISAMGAGNKLDPTGFEVTDIYKTSVCPLARVMRSELRKRGVKRLKVVYSKEVPTRPNVSEQSPAPGKNQVPGSCAFVPSVVGLIIAGEVVKDIVKA